MIDSIVKFFDGKKTFISAAIVFIVSGLLATGMISAETAQVIYGLATALGLTLVRMNQK